MSNSGVVSHTNISDSVFYVCLFIAMKKYFLLFSFLLLYCATAVICTVMVHQEKLSILSKTGLQPERTTLKDVLVLYVIVFWPEGRMSPIPGSKENCAYVASELCVCVYLYLYVCEDHFEYKPYWVRTFLESEAILADPHIHLCVCACMCV